MKGTFNLVAERTSFVLIEDDILREKLLGRWCLLRVDLLLQRWCGNREEHGPCDTTRNRGAWYSKTIGNSLRGIRTCACAHHCGLKHPMPSRRARSGGGSNSSNHSYESINSSHRDQIKIALLFLEAKEVFRCSLSVDVEGDAFGYRFKID